MGLQACAPTLGFLSVVIDKDMGVESVITQASMVEGGFGFSNWRERVLSYTVRQKSPGLGGTRRQRERGIQP